MKWNGTSSRSGCRGGAGSCPTGGVVPWLLVDPSGEPVAPVRQFLVDFVARGNRAGSVRSYAYELLRWWRWLRAGRRSAGDKATSAEVRDFVLWLGQASKAAPSGRAPCRRRTAGTVNPMTRKQHLDDRYQPRTVRHCNAVLRAFYEFWIERGEGPLVNPVPLDAAGSRPERAPQPAGAVPAEGRLRYNPTVAQARAAGDAR